MARNKIIIDLDGCFSDDRWRRPYLSRSHDAYHDRMMRDSAANLGKLRRAIGECGEQLIPGVGPCVEIVVATGRPEKYRLETETWMRAKLTPILNWPFKLLMRTDAAPALPSPSLKVAQLRGKGISMDEVFVAFDDRNDVLEAYIAEGLPETRAVRLVVPEGANGRPAPSEEQPAAPAGGSRAAEMLVEMAETVRERNAVYQDNWRIVPELVKALWPDGVPPELVTSPQWHLFELKLVKLTRFAASGLKHRDSIRDDGVYSALIESILEEQGE